MVKKFFWNSLSEVMIASSERTQHGLAVRISSIGKLHCWKTGGLTRLLHLHVTAHLPTRLVQPAAAVSSTMAGTRHPPTPHQKSQLYYYNSVTCFCNKGLLSSLSQPQASLCCGILVHFHAVAWVWSHWMFCCLVVFCFWLYLRGLE